MKARVVVHERARRSRWRNAAVGIGLALAIVAPAGITASAATPSFISPAADWLTTVNYYRAMAGVGPVTEDPSLSAGAVNHSCYMLFNGISHDEVPGFPGYTPEGDLAGNNGNVAVSSQINTSARSHVELWMTGPFHAIGVLRPNLQRTGFGKCDLDSTPTWHSGATLDVIRGLGSSPRPSVPILFPGDGTTTNLNRFIAESQPADLLQLDGRRRPADHRDDARGSQRSIGDSGRPRWTDRDVRALRGEHQRRRPTAPPGGQRSGDRAAHDPVTGPLQRERLHHRSRSQLELHRRPCGGSR